MKSRSLPLLAAAALAACILPHPARAADASLKKLVLQPGDVPSTLGPFRATTAAALGMPGSAPRIPGGSSHSHGFQGSTGSFLVPSGSNPRSIGLIDDGTFRFSTSAGAQWLLEQYRQGAILTHARVSTVAIGNGGATWVEGGKSQGNFLFWREGRYLGEVSLVFRGKAQLAPTLQLARILDAKLRSAQ